MKYRERKEGQGGQGAAFVVAVALGMACIVGPSGLFCSRRCSAIGHVRFQLQQQAGGRGRGGVRDRPESRV